MVQNQQHSQQNSKNVEQPNSCTLNVGVEIGSTTWEKCLAVSVS